MSHSFHNKLQDNAESSDTFINKAVLTVASYTKTIYYKYNRIPVFYHLPFAFMETNSKMGLFKYSAFICFTYCIFYLYVYIFWRFAKNDFIFVFCIALWNICYMHLFFQDMEDDFNRILDFLINFWVSFQISFLNFINVLHMFLYNLLWRQLN